MIILLSQFFLHFKVFLHVLCIHPLTNPLPDAYHVSGPLCIQAIFSGHSTNTNEQRNFALRSLMVKGYFKCFSLVTIGETRTKATSLFSWPKWRTHSWQMFTQVYRDGELKSPRACGHPCPCSRSSLQYHITLRLHNEDWVEAWSHLSHQPPFLVLQLNPCRKITSQDEQVLPALPSSMHSFQRATDLTVLLCL